MSVYAHVWVNNEEGLQWYLNRGFEIEGGVFEGYYRRLNPSGAWVVRRAIPTVLPVNGVKDEEAQEQGAQERADGAEDEAAQILRTQGGANVIEDETAQRPEIQDGQDAGGDVR